MLRKKDIIDSILKLIKEGKYPSEIAKELKLSAPAIHKRIKKLEQAGILERRKGYPAFYEIKRGFNHPIMGDEDINLSKRSSVNNPERVLEPHRFGEWFRISSGEVKGGQEWSLLHGVKAHKFKEPDFTIICYSQRFVIWLKRFRGRTPNQMIAWGRAAIRMRAELFAAQHGLLVEFERYAGPREYTTTTLGTGLSKAVIDAFELEKGPKPVGEALLSTDKSHPLRAELTSPKEKVADLYAERWSKFIGSDRFIEDLELFEKMKPGFLTLAEKVSRIEASMVSEPKLDGERREIF